MNSSKNSPPVNSSSVQSSKIPSSGQTKTQQSSNRPIQRKPQNLQIKSRNQRFISSKQDHIIDDTRYMALSPLKLDMVVREGKKSDRNGEDDGHLHVQMQFQDAKTQRKDNEKVLEKSGRKINDDSADYYKYWKKKANEYQEMNFNLHRVNSAIQQQNQILKHTLDKMQKKLIKMYEPEPIKNTEQQNYQKLQNYYRIKMDQLVKKISQQQILITKQNKKIKELSNYISENYQLKHLLDNMQQKVSEMRSIGSREQQMQKFSQKGNRKKKGSGYLTIQSPNLNTRSNYTIIKEKKNSLNNTYNNRSPTQYY